MKTAVLVAPFFAPNTIRYLRALLGLEGCRPAVISQDPAERLPADVRGGLAAYQRVSDCLSGPALAQACRAIAAQLGRVDVLFGVLEQLQLPVAEARDLVGIPGMGLEVVRGFRDKSQMKAILRAAGVPVARSALIESAQDARRFAGASGFPLILKPVDGLGSRSTYRIESEGALEQALAALKPAVGRPLQAEEFVVGRERTCETVCLAGRPVWSSGTYYLNRPLEVLENPWMQYTVLLPREEARPEFSAFAPTNHAALKALSMGTGLTHMEWFERADGSHLVNEVGARPPGVQIMPLMSLAYERDFIGLWVRLMVHGAWPDDLQRRWATGAAFFRAQGAGRRVTAVLGLEEAQRKAGALVVEAQLPVVGQPRAEGYEGEGYALVRAETTEAVRDALRHLVTHVQVRC
jgi:hypothetical protein